MDITAKIAEELGIRKNQAQAAIQLIDEGNTIPFIARYRKEATGALNDEILRNLFDRLTYLRNLEEKKAQVIASIEEQGKLTDELRKQIEEAQTLVVVDDLYRPYRPKRRTRATIAKEKGLEPLANVISLQMLKTPILEEAAKYINEEKEVHTAEEALEGARDIIAEHISDEADYRIRIRDLTVKHGRIVSAAKDPETESVYEMYYDFDEPIAKMAGHRTLALNRGEAEKILTVKVEVPEEQIIPYLQKKVITKDNAITRPVLEEVIEDSYKRLIAPAIEREIRSDLTEKAEDGAIKVFGKNLEQLLMQPPIAGQVVLGWDPAFRTGCKLAVVDPTGKVLDTTVIYPTAPQNKVEEAKTVFANAIVYISRFAGQKPFVRKYNDRIATREYVKEQLYLSTREAWQERVKSDEEFAAEGLKLKKVVQEKQRRGEKLNRREEMFLNYEPQPPMSYADMLKRYQGELFDLFGEDEAAYARYYRENIDYFYGGEGMYVLSIDEDVKSLGIPYNDKRLLDTAIRLLEKGKETEKANRILHRYTLCRFEAPQEWRTWYEKNKERLFFTESGGWLFMVNTREPDPANDYSARYAQPVQETSSRPAATDDRNPVQMVAGLEKAANGNREIVVRLKIHPGYHIYAYVAESDPFVTTQVELQLPEGWTIVGKPKLPSAKSYNKQGTTVYEDEAIFRYEISGSGQGEAKCTVSYQCCDAHICFPPIEKELKVMLK